MGQTKCTLSNEELIEKCNEWVSKLAKSGGRDWRLHVPVSFNTDPDMLFCELANRFKELLPPPYQASEQGEEILLYALKKIQNPVAAMQAELEEGYVLDGVNAVALSENHTYLKEIARKAIYEYEQLLPPKDEEFFLPPDEGEGWHIGSDTFTRQEVFNLLWTQRAMIVNDVKQIFVNKKNLYDILNNPRTPKF